jgi:hypothetical protein
MSSSARYALLGLATFAVAASSLHAQDDKAAKMAMPGSMDEFINWHIDKSKFGDWSVTGTTKDMWVGIPAGIAYTETSSVTLSDDRTRIIRSYMMSTEDGKVISVGSGFTYWDAATNAPVSSNSGFDMGQPYNGTSKLMGMTDDALFWEYTEHSRGETTVYRNSERMVSPVSVRNSVRKAGSDDKPWESDLARVNHLKAHGLDALVGSWVMEAPDGSVIRTGTSWAANEQAIVSRQVKTAPSGDRIGQSMSVMFWDPAASQVVMIYNAGNGTVFSSIVASAERKGDELTVVNLYNGTGSTGISMSGVLTQVIKGDTMTSTFSDTSLMGHPNAFMWSDVPLISKRMERRRRPEGGRAR